MPDPRELIEQGRRYESGGVPDRALDAYARAAADGSPRIRAEALRRSADVLRSRCDWDGALVHARQSRATAEAAEQQDLVAEAINAEAAVYHSRGDLACAAELYTAMLPLTEDLRIRGIALQNLGSIAAMRGDFEEAERHFIESEECFEQDGYTRGVVFSLNNHGRAALDRGLDDVAHDVLIRAESTARALMDLDLHALTRINLAESFLRAGEPDRAEELVSAALGYYGTTGNHWRRLECLRVMGDIATVREQQQSARNFFEAAIRIATSIGAARELELLQQRLAACHGG